MTTVGSPQPGARNAAVQIGVIGSAADLQFTAACQEMAYEVGRLIAASGATLIFEAEADMDSLSTAACRAATEVGGLTVGISYGKSRYEIPGVSGVTIITGMERGGGREAVVVFSCDAIIALGGGSGTLTEIAMAYQAGIPVVALKGTGGWSDRLAGEYLDERRRMRLETAEGPQEAVRLAIQLASERRSV